MASPQKQLLHVNPAVLHPSVAYHPSVLFCPYQLQVLHSDPVEALRQIFLHIAEGNTAADYYEITVRATVAGAWLANAVWVRPTLDVEDD